MNSAVELEKTNLKFVGLFERIVSLNKTFVPAPYRFEFGVMGAMIWSTMGTLIHYDKPKLWETT